MSWGSLHFLRPEWFLALIPAGILLWQLWRSDFSSQRWAEFCDRHLQPYVLVNRATASQKLMLAGMALIWLMTIIALAGPTWEKRPVPVLENQQAMIIILDLSASMHSTDINPSRLERTRIKIRELLQMRKEGQTGLIVFAGQSFIVSPLTTDHKTVDHLVSSLNTDLMPTQGSNVASALHKAQELFQQTGVFQDGYVVLFADSVADTSSALQAAQSLHGKHHRLSVIGSGTIKGAPAKLPDGSLLKDRGGNPVIAPLQRDILQQLSNLGGGVYVDLSSLDTDLKAVIAATPAGNINPEHLSETADQWLDMGAWIPLLLAPLGAFAFRRGWLMSLALAFILIRPDTAMALEWQSLWKNDNQIAYELLQQGETDAAAERFQQPDWKATASYRAGKFEQATELFGEQSADQLYNQGNALAQMQKFDEAIQKYQQALSIDPEHADAQYNLEKIQEWLEQQAQQSQSQESESTDQQQADKQESNQQQNGGRQDAAKQQDQQQSDQAASSQSPESDQEQDTSNQQQAAQEPQQQEPQSLDNESEDSENTQTDEEIAQQDEQAQQAIKQSSSPEEALSEEQLATEQWLRQVPDDPGGLLRRKFYQQAIQEKQQPSAGQPW